MFSMEEFSLSGQTALIIGGTGGIGREIARGYQTAGAKVIVAGRSHDKLKAMEQELGGGDGPPRAYEADVRAVDALATLAERIECDHGGGVDILVNCQGTIAIKPATELTESEYDAILDTNLKSVFFACTTFAQRMQPRGFGVIINITSLAAHSGWANGAAYGASKWGVAGITQSFAAEWGAAGLRVNAIAPGFFLTDLNREKMGENRKQEARRRSAQQRMGELPELVGAAIFLASNSARFINGATLRVDGGYLVSGI